MTEPKGPRSDVGRAKQLWHVGVRENDVLTALDAAGGKRFEVVPN